MKREVKFRGRDTVTGKWRYGGLIFIDRGKPHIFCELGAVEVDPATVGQFTGVKDKNGTKIYEDDIVSIQFDADRAVPMSVLLAEGMWGMRENLDYEEYHCLYDYLDDATVIGNIHDNPELLKECKDA